VNLLALMFFLLPHLSSVPPPPEAWRSVDWSNSTLDLGDGSYRFVRGAYAKLDHAKKCKLCLGFVGATKYGDVDGDGHDEAAIMVLTNRGGEARTLDAHLFSLEGGKLVHKATIKGGDRGEGGVAAVDIVDGVLQVRRFQSQPSDGVCCPSRVLVERWQWQKDKLVKLPGAPPVETRQPKPWVQYLLLERERIIP
jgi:hypothetical protein